MSAASLIGRDGERAGSTEKKRDRKGEPDKRDRRRSKAEKTDLHRLEWFYKTLMGIVHILIFLKQLYDYRQIRLSLSLCLIGKI